MAQSAGNSPPDFPSGHEIGVLGSSPREVLSSAGSRLESLSLPPALHPSPSPRKINETFNKNKKHAGAYSYSPGPFTALGFLTDK